MQEVVELDGKVTKVTDSIETLQEIIHGLKVELEQLKRDHCAIMQYLLHLPVRDFIVTCRDLLKNLSLRIFVSILFDVLGEIVRHVNIICANKRFF